MNMPKPNCYECAHRGIVPGDAHSCCRYPGNKTGLFDFFTIDNKQNAILLGIRGHPHGIKMGWFMWPVNFDPVWLEHCEGFEARRQWEGQ